MATTWGLRRLQQSLSKGKPSSLYFIFGEEDYLASEALSLIRSKSTVEGLEDFNFDSFEIPNDPISKIKDAVETFPMMAPQRLVICKGIEKLKDRDIEVLKPLVESPVESCILVLVAKKVDKRKKYFKHLSTHGISIELNTPYENQIPSWIDYLVVTEGLDIHRKARSLLQQLVGSNLSELRNEIIKIKSYIGGRLNISEDDILRVVSRSRLHSVFDLTDAIGQKNIPKALTFLAQILNRGESEVGTFALILRHFRILTLIQQGQKEGFSGQRLSSFAGAPHFFLRSYQKQSTLWRGKQIQDAIERLHETDRALKSSPAPSHIWLENFIVKSCCTS